MAEETEALLASQGENNEGGEWTQEIKEAREARNQAMKYLMENPRPVPPRGLMQRQPGSDRTLGRRRSTTPITPTGITAKN